MDPINLACFSQPHWRVLARGLDHQKWYNEGVYEGTGGITMPQPLDLRVGHRYYRFASSNASRVSQVGGEWWLDFENYSKIKRYAESHNLRLSHAARLFLALPVDWTRVDRLVSAILEAPLRAYAGKGAVAAGESDKWTPVQHIPVLQLYIPGLRPIPNLWSQELYKEAFPKPVVEMIANR